MADIKCNKPPPLHAPAISLSHHRRPPWMANTEFANPRKVYLIFCQLYIYPHLSFSDITLNLTTFLIKWEDEMSKKRRGGYRLKTGVRCVRHLGRIWKMHSLQFLTLKSIIGREITILSLYLSLSSLSLPLPVSATFLSPSLSTSLAIPLSALPPPPDGQNTDPVVCKNSKSLSVNYMYRACCLSLYSKL